MRNVGRRSPHGAQPCGPQVSDRSGRSNLGVDVFGGSAELAQSLQ